MKEIKLNRIYIIQSLSPDCLASSLGRIKPELISMLVAANNGVKTIEDGGVFDIVERDITDITSLSSLLLEIMTDCKAETKPLLHFICHGAVDSEATEVKDMVPGICIWDSVSSDYCTVKREDFIDYLREINKLCKNNAFLSMCSCHGFWMNFDLFKGDNTIPYTGIISSPHPLTYSTTRIFSQIIPMLLLQPEGYCEARKSINALLEKENGKYKTAHPERINDLYYFDESDTRFYELYQKELISFNRQEATEKEKFAIGLLKTKGYPVTQQNIEIVINGRQSNMSEIYRSVRDKIFMFDTYPDIKDSFDLPDEISI